MSRDERYGIRSLVYSKWHRLYLGSHVGRVACQRLLPAPTTDPDHDDSDEENNHA